MRMRAGPSLMARLYGLLLACYPAAFRAEFGPEMETVFQAALSGQGMNGPGG
jgi:hypothetical protein